MLYVLDPKFSDVPRPEAEAFHHATLSELSTTQVSRVSSIGHLLETDPGAADGLVFFSPLLEECASEIEALLERAVNAGTVILPIAMSDRHRRPPSVVENVQSFDVTDQCRRRGLVYEQHEVVARAFAREALSMLQPTYMHDRLRLFLSYRRRDGEELTARLDARLQDLHEQVFRDLVDIRTGDAGPKQIDEALGTADVLVLLETPSAAESHWIAYELTAALGRAIPIVWVQLGPTTERAPLPVQPGPRPDIRWPDLSPDDAAVGGLAEDILQTAFQLARAHVRASQQAVRALQKWARSHGAAFETLDARRMVFQISYDRGTRRYPTRRATDVVQFYARHPTDDDRQALERFLIEQGLGPHHRECRSFDAALMLDPSATDERVVGDWSVVEHPERFLGSLTQFEAEGGHSQRARLLLLGAFPAEVASHHEVTAALHAVVATWLRLGGALTFGGHPTFTPLVTETARLIVPDEMHKRVTVYQSEWFTSAGAVTGVDLVDVQRTPRARDREASLTIMRTEMIRRGTAEAAVCIGGRTDEGGIHEPGLDDEIRLAQLAEIPLYLLGAPGGRTAELAAAARDSGEWTSLRNSLNANDNGLLLQTPDYEQATRLIWNTTVS